MLRILLNERGANIPYSGVFSVQDIVNSSSGGNTFLKVYRKGLPQRSRAAMGGYGWRFSVDKEKADG